MPIQAGHCRQRGLRDPLASLLRCPPRPARHRVPWMCKARDKTRMGSACGAHRQCGRWLKDNPVTPSRHGAMLAGSRPASCGGAAELGGGSWLIGCLLLSAGHCSPVWAAGIVCMSISWKAANCFGMLAIGFRCSLPVSLLESRWLQPHLSRISGSHTASAIWVQWLPNIIPILLLQGLQQEGRSNAGHVPTRSHKLRHNTCVEASGSRARQYAQTSLLSRDTRKDSRRVSS